MRTMILALLLTATPAFAAGPGPIPAPKATVTFTQGTHSVSLPATSPNVCLGIQGSVIRGSVGTCTAGSFVQFPKTGGDVTPHWSAQDVCPVKPPAQTQHASCPAGTKGNGWTQTADYTSVAAPTCWQLGPFVPTDPPAGTCVAIPPPTGGLKLDLSFVDKTSGEYADFIGQANRDDAAASDLIKAFMLTGTDSYRARAVTVIDAYFTDVQNDINAGHDPDLAGDSYLYAGGHIAEMSLVYAYGNPSAAQKSKWGAIADQTIFNIWNPNQAKWGSRSAPWSGWATDDPNNNYHMRFMLGTATWALASGEQTLLDYTNNVRWPYFDAAWNQNLGGGSLEGTGYGYAMSDVFFLYELWRDSGRGDRANATVQVGNTAESWIHGTLPTLDLFVPIGDQSRVSMPVIYDYQRGLVEIAQYLSTNAAVKSDAGWWLSHIALQHDDMYRANYGDDIYPYSRNAPEPAAKTFRSPSVGFASGRTAWATNATFFSVLMGTLNESHAHREQGSFIFYKGTWLSVTPNVNSHSGINATYRGKNVIRFQKGATVKEQDYASVNVTNYSANAATGEFHITGDMTPLYQVGDNRGVNGWQRTADFVGGVATITDTVSLAAGTTATFQLQVPTTTAPTIAGNVITAGGLRATILAPASATVTVVNMTGVNDDSGGSGDYMRGYRVEWACPGACKVELRSTQ